MNANPFAQITVPVSKKAGTAKAGFSKPGSATFLAHPSATSPTGLRDLAILRLLANGVTLRQIHKLNLQDIDEAQGVLVVHNRNRKQRVIILENSDQQILARWLVVRRLFAAQTEAVFISLHWTTGRSEPGQRLSERGIQAMIGKYRQPGKNL